MWKSILKTGLEIIAASLDDKYESKKLFSIKCLECGCIRELEDRFLKRSGDIEVDNEVNYADENIVSIQCDKCRNRIVSSE
jgi:hypothetical protein